MSIFLALLQTLGSVVKDLKAGFGDVGVDLVPKAAGEESHFDAAFAHGRIHVADRAVQRLCRQLGHVAVAEHGLQQRCSGVDTVGVLTQYQPLRLNAHIGIGIPWDLDRNVGGVTILPPYERSKGSDWYTGTANAIYQNLEYMESYNPEYVLILSGDHIYKMDYEVMLEYHKANNADVTIAAMPVPIEEASRFGILITDDRKNIGKNKTEDITDN